MRKLSLMTSPCGVHRRCRAAYRGLVPGLGRASGHIVSLRHPAAVVEEVQAALARGHRIHTSSRGGGIRVSLHAYNCTDDVLALSDALASIGPH